MVLINVSESQTVRERTFSYRQWRAKGAEVKKRTAKKSKISKSQNSKASRMPVPWDKIHKMWKAGESYEAISKATDPHYNSKNPDPTKSTRAKVSRAMTLGVMISGKVVRFKPRSRKEFEKKTKPSKESKRNNDSAREQEASTSKQLADS